VPFCLTSNHMKGSYFQSLVNLCSVLLITWLMFKLGTCSITSRIKANFLAFIYGVWFSFKTKLRELRLAFSWFVHVSHMLITSWSNMSTKLQISLSFQSRKKGKGKVSTTWRHTCLGKQRLSLKTPELFTCHWLDLWDMDYQKSLSCITSP
jgi:hypothetical protein